MGIEIERKFLVVNDSWRDHIVSKHQMCQGYLGSCGTTSVRVRVSDDQAHLNIKSGGLTVKRLEYEYEIPLQDGRELLDTLAGGLVEKTRYQVECGGHIWDLDIFEGDNAGLEMAEVELASEDETFEMPGWAGREVSYDPRYYNVTLIENPYKNWRDEA